MVGLRERPGEAAVFRGILKENCLAGQRQQQEHAGWYLTLISQGKIVKGALAGLRNCRVIPQFV